MLIFETTDAGTWAASLIGFAVTGFIAVIVFVLLRLRGNRIRSAEADPRVVSETMSVDFGGSAADLIDFLRGIASSMKRPGTTIDESSSKLTLQTPPNARTWGQYLQIDIAPQKGSWKLTLASWPSRDRQTVDTRAGGRKAIDKFEKSLLNELEKQRASPS